MHIIKDQKEHLQYKKITILLIGNKADLDNQRVISKEQGEEKAKSFNVAFLETSAMNGQNLDTDFEMMIKEVYDKCHSEIEDDGMGEFSSGEDINLAKPNQNSNKKKCCQD